MPLLEFECLECGKVFEKLVRKSDEDVEVVCPVCGSLKVEGILSTFSSPAKGSTSGSCAPSGG